ncbi:MAG TPA: HEAT repeat domain-containing protein [Terriglobia bacterium]|nr:HEAT repeat domain-containing protein [Terriglobia bacterium]
MTCKEYQHQITLFLYDELSESARFELETHLHNCASCQGAYESEKAMHSVLAEDAIGWDDIPSDLLVESRKALADQLDRIEKKRSWWRMPAFSVVFTPMRMLESAALVAMGLALGVYVSNQRPVPVQTASNTGQDSQISLLRNGTISNLQVVNSDPVTGQVELAGEVSQPLRFQGKMEDDTVRNLLFSALRDANNPGSRLKAVEVLSQKPTDESIEEALINALVYDDDAGVRMRALEGLKKFADEQHVRAAFMHTLQNDDTAGIRIAAIDALMAHNSKDPAFAKSLEEAAKNDDNAYIRRKVLQFVGTSK